MKKHSHSSKFVLARALYAFLDVVVVFLIGILAFYSQIIDGHSTSTQLMWIFVYIASVAVTVVLAFIIFRVYKMITSNFGIYETVKISFITLIIQVLGLIAIVIVPDEIIPSPTFSIWILTTIALAFIFPSIRIAARVVKTMINSLNKRDNVRTLVIGAGAVAKIVVDESRSNKMNKNNIVVLVDDNPDKIGGTFSNIPVEGPISDVSKIINRHKVEEVIIAISDLTAEKLDEILHFLESCSVRVKRAPLLSEMSGPNDIRIMDVDLDELLCRKPIKLDNSDVFPMLNGKTVLVTGAGGSIGSELVRQIFMTKPKTLVLFDIYENSTYDIQMELTRKIREEKINDVQLVTLIGSTYNLQRMTQVFEKYHPDYIYHAAAYKHVPLMEDSPQEAIRTNVIGTYNVAFLADKYKVTKMVLVSTDKAVRPTNVMGATKRFAETIIQYFSDKSKHTQYAAVRFGNVLGSNGSVVPLFKKQIEAGGPVTITDKNIIRYFMTIPEAVSLILQCSLFAEGGEIFILDMGEPVKIITLAEKLIRQAGYIPYKDIKIIETGLRPGEKLYEELLVDKKKHQKTANNRIFIEEKSQIQPIEEEIQEISKVFDLTDNKDIKKLLCSIIKTYQITDSQSKNKGMSK